ncbi:YecA family protein [Planctomycetota bacterium]
MKTLSRNAPCPCNSGRKYKRCCIDKGFKYVVDEDDNIFREVPVNEGLAQAFRDMKRDFISVHGREPGPDDLLFPDLPHPEVVEHQMAKAMRAADIDPAMIYAFEKTGRLVTEDNQHLVPHADMEEWVQAIEGYRAMPELPDSITGWPPLEEESEPCPICAQLAAWREEGVGQDHFFDEDGNEIDVDAIPKPSLCVTCKKDSDPAEWIVCTLTRADQQDQADFECYAFQPSDS